MKKYLLHILLVSLMYVSCNENVEYKKQLNSQELYLEAFGKLTSVITYDIFSPPVASRIYAYTSIAAYEAIIPAYGDKYQSLENQLNGLEEIPKPTDKNVNHHLASIHAFLEVSKELVFSEEKITDYQESIYEKLKSEGLSNKEFKSSIAYGDQISKHIVAWADLDMYKETRSFPKYTVVNEEHLWKPTPPDYMQGIEPHWKQIRTMVLKTANQFPPLDPVEFDLNKESEFYRQLDEVYVVGSKLTEEETAIASFWDCNPFVSHHRGHAMFATKKITPGGHWMSITGIACKIKKTTIDEAIEAHALASISLFDAFISCWEAKYRTALVRPETLINQFIDEEWQPLLQTPPFPEYTSGHSVASRSAAVALTEIFGDDFSFLDTSELEFGLPAREYKSFYQASEEAAISRLYGGIHYMMAIENGVTQGGNVGDYIAENLETRIVK